MKIVTPFTKPNKSILTIALLSASLTVSSATIAAGGLALDTSRDLAFSAVASGVVVLDISTASNPSLVSEEIQAQALINDVFYQASKGLLYIATENSEMEIWDVQDASSPQRLSITKITYFDAESSIISIAVVGDIARVTTGYETFHTIDVSNPDSPSVTGFSRNSQTHEIELADDGNLYRTGQSTLQMTPDPSGEIISSTGNQYFRSTQIAAEDGFIYANANNTLHVVSSESGLPFVTSVSTGSNIRDIAVENDVVYIAASSGLDLWDVSDKSAPYKIGSDDSGSLSNVVVFGDYAYTRNGNVDFSVYDVSIANNPVVIGAYSADGSSGGSGGAVSNLAPIADAGMTQGVKARTRGVTLDGNSSYDLDGDIVSYSWIQTSGKSVSLAGADTATPTFKAPGTKRKVKTLEFTLTVTDDDGATGSSSVAVSVYPK